MQSAMTSLRIHAKNQALKRGTENAITRLCANPSCVVRVSTRIAQNVLIQHPTFISRGETYSTRVRNIGAGVKELYLVNAN